MPLEYVDWKDTVVSDTSGNFLSNAAPKLGETITISLWVHKNNDIEKVLFMSSMESYGMQKEMLREPAGDGFYDKYVFQYKILHARTLYYFAIRTKDQRIYFFDNAGLHEEMSSYKNQFRIVAGLELAAWVNDAVFYQIFTDRFYDARPDPAGLDFEYDGYKRIAKKWDEPLSTYTQARCFDHYGGDLEGIRQKIPYLKDLGVNALYLNPIFASPPNHKYHTEDYFEIDPGYGTKEDFARLTKALHDNGIRVILDGVFNHVGYYHRWFNRFNKYEPIGAYNTKDSPYSDFFVFEKHPEKYFAWFDVPEMPVLNYESQKLRDAIYRKKDSVMQYWLDQPYNIDGWRLDVFYHMGNYPTRHVNVGAEIGREMRQTIKKEFKDKFLLGESFHDVVSYLQGDTLDSVMNYQGFLTPTWSFIGDRRCYILDAGWHMGMRQVPNRAEILSRELADVRNGIAAPMMFQLYNHIGSHDTPRIREVLRSPDKVKIAATLQFAYPGVPSIYYGDEIGYVGGDDPYNRKPFNWDEKAWDHDARDYYRSLIALRKKYAALRDGSYKELLAANDVFAFARFKKDEVLIAIINPGCACSVDLPCWKAGKIDNSAAVLLANKNVDISSVKAGILKVKIPENAAAIIALD